MTQSSTIKLIKIDQILQTLPHSSMWRKSGRRTRRQNMQLDLPEKSSAEMSKLGGVWGDEKTERKKTVIESTRSKEVASCGGRLSGSICLSHVRLELQVAWVDMRLTWDVKSRRSLRGYAARLLYEYHGIQLGEIEYNGSDWDSLKIQVKVRGITVIWHFGELNGKLKFLLDLLGKKKN